MFEVYEYRDESGHLAGYWVPDGDYIGQFVGNFSVKVWHWTGDDEPRFRKLLARIVREYRRDKGRGRALRPGEAATTFCECCIS